MKKWSEVVVEYSEILSQPFVVVTEKEYKYSAFSGPTAY
jgi:hypothetical protein